tara:strand:+ start:1405 stop:2733 length:1329 start_codon:yes stop_codon:yes gene_type:complete
MRTPVSYAKKLLKSRFQQTPVMVTNKEILTLFQATLLNYVMTPLVGSVDTFWISKLGNDAVLAGQGTADRIFNSVYSIASFAPYIVTPIISKYDARGEYELIPKIVLSSFILVGFIGILMTISIIANSHFAISLIIPQSSPSFRYAIKYLRIRIFGFCFSLLNSLAFAVMRGRKDVKTPIRINLISQITNIILDPILMHKMGITGIAIGTVIAEIVAFVLFYSSLISQKIIKFSNIDFKLIRLLISRGLNVQTRSVCLSIMYLLSFRYAQKIDLSGSTAAAHVLNLQIFEIGYIITRSLGLICPMLLPRFSTTRPVEKKLYYCGTFVASLAMIINFTIGNQICSFFTKSPQVLSITRDVIPVSSILQFICGITCITEGMLQSYSHYKTLCVGSMISLATTFLLLPKTSTLPQMWFVMSLSTTLREILNIIVMKYGKHKDDAP